MSEENSTPQTGRVGQSACVWLPDGAEVLLLLDFFFFTRVGQPSRYSREFASGFLRLASSYPGAFSVRTDQLRIVGRLVGYRYGECGAELPRWEPGDCSGMSPGDRPCMSMSVAWTDHPAQNLRMQNRVVWPVTWCALYRTGTCTVA